MVESILARSREVMPRVVEWRREIHRHPELAFAENRTSAIIAEHLTGLGFSVTERVATTGIVADLEGSSTSQGTIGLRADMDALPVEEQTGLPFASTDRTEWRGETVPVMHACGHDAHVAILMGAASVIAAHRKELKRRVRLIFQPAEEIIPSGKNGAETMMEEGVLQGVDEIFGLHVTQSLPSGVLGIRSGPVMASVDELGIDVIGSQTHGAYPWRGVDPIVAASQIVVALQTIVSRRLDLISGPAVVTIGSVHGGVRSNIIPEKVRLEGTIRTLDQTARDVVHELVQRTASATAEAAGARADVQIRHGYPVTVNHRDATAWGRDVLTKAAGEKTVVDVPPVFGGEDFAFFLERIPGAFFFLGVRPPGVPLAEAVPNHSPRFDVDEPALLDGVRAMSALALHSPR